MSNKVSELTPEQHALRKEKSRLSSMRWRATGNSFKSAFIGRKAYAKKAGIEWAIRFEDLVQPSHCPVLGIKLFYGSGRGAGPKADCPSIDRIDPRRGYVPGNVAVISHRANIIKQNATVDEVESVAKWMREQGL